MNKKYVLGLTPLLVLSMALAYTWMDADFNNDGTVDLVDQGIFSAYYGSNNCNVNNSWCNETDINEDGNVNLADWSIFGGYYGCPGNSTNETPNSTCWS